jgi:hypothetical protein
MHAAGILVGVEPASAFVLTIVAVVVWGIAFLQVAAAVG